MNTIKNIFLLTLCFCSIVSFAGTFEDASKSLVIIEASNEKLYLAAAVQFDDGAYVVTSQSLFLDPIPKFSMKSFKDTKLKQIGFEFDPKSDLVRIKIEASPDISPLEIAPAQSGRKNVFSIDQDEIVYMANATGDELGGRNFEVAAGNPIINHNNQFVGVASRTDDGFGKYKTYKIVPLLKDIKWGKALPFNFSKQVLSLDEMIVFHKAIDFLRDHNTQNTFISIDTNSHPKLMSWIKDQNDQAFKTLLSRESTSSMGVAVREHNYRCFYYTSLKRLTSFYVSNAQMAKKTRWKSLYLKNRSKIIHEKSLANANALKAEMQSIVEAHPSTKVK